MKRTCQIILGTLLVSCAISSFMAILPGSNGAVRSVLAVSHGLRLTATVVGLILGIAFLAFRRFREKGTSLPLLTVIVSAYFGIMLFGVPIFNAMRWMQDPRIDFLSPGSRVVVFQPDAPGGGVAVLNTQAQRWTASMQKGTCTINNLTAEMLLAQYITISRMSNAGEVEVVAHRVQEDSAPFYREVDIRKPDAASSPVVSSFSAPQAQLIRINGQTMSLGEAADRYPRIPPATKIKP